MCWSESERLLQGTHGSYGLDATMRIVGKDSVHLEEICRAAGALGLSVGGTAPTTTATGRPNVERLHFVLRCEDQSQADEIKAKLSKELTRIHESYTQEVCGSLVLRGFPASWSEKGLKFVFAPFGGLSSIALEEESQAGASTSSVRLAYVKLRNAAVAAKAVTNLHQTKVGDGDLVEECVISCCRWHLRGWSDGSFHVSFFLDQLSMNRRPEDVEPGPEDKELFVRNLPLQDMNRQQLQEYFEGFGEIEDLYLVRDTFSGEATGEGYVRFRQHGDAVRCIEALTPDPEGDTGEAEATDLAGAWSESERALQRKANCYRFSLLAELVGADGSGLERLKTESNVESLWLMADSLQQRDRSAPPPSGRQMHFVARCTDESQVETLRECLERAVDEVHGKIGDRIEKRERKEQAIADGLLEDKANRAHASTGPPPFEQHMGGMPMMMEGGSPKDQAPWGGWRPPHAFWPPGWQPPPGGAPPAGVPPSGKGGPAQAPHMMGPFDPFRYPGQMPGYPPGSGPSPWGPPPPQLQGQASVFEQAARRPEEDEKHHGDDQKPHSHHRRRREGNDWEREHRSGSRKRRRRHGSRIPDSGHCPSRED